VRKGRCSSDLQLFKRQCNNREIRNSRKEVTEEVISDRTYPSGQTVNRRMETMTLQNTRIENKRASGKGGGRRPKRERVVAVKRIFGRAKHERVRTSTVDSIVPALNTLQRACPLGGRKKRQNSGVALGRFVGPERTVSIVAQMVESEYSNIAKSEREVVRVTPNRDVEKRVRGHVCSKNNLESKMRTPKTPR